MQKTINEYHEYLRGKNVILVGPAGYLEGQGLGKKIDGYDVVVRVNHAVPVRFPKDYGSRTDILYHAMTISVLLREPNKDTSKTVKVWTDNVTWFVSALDVDKRCVKQLKPHLDKMMPWIAIEGRYYDGLQNEIGNKLPSTGILTLAHLIDSPAKSVTVKGFDFYSSGTYKGYPGGVNYNVGAFDNQWHDGKAQIKYLKSRLSPRLILDQNLQKLIKRG